MNTIITEQPINNQSFFKLPLIFIAIFFVIFFTGIQTVIFLNGSIPFEVFLSNLTYSFLSFLLPLFLFFVTAIFCCQKYRLHSVIDSWLKVTLIAIIFATLYMVWAFLIGFVHSFFIIQLRENMNMNMSTIMLWATLFVFAIRIIAYILFIFILIFLFSLFSNRSVSSRKVFKLEGGIGSRVHSHIYSLLMLFLLIVFISYGVSARVRSMSLNLDIHNIEILSLLITFAFLLINYMIFYFSTRNCFKRIEPIVKLDNLIITVLITNLFIFISELVIFAVVALFIGQFLFMGVNSIPGLIITLFIIGSVISLILSYVFSRLSVKIIYG